MNAGISPDGAAVPDGEFVLAGHDDGSAKQLTLQFGMQYPAAQQSFVEPQYHRGSGKLFTQPVQLPSYCG